MTNQNISYQDFNTAKMKTNLISPNMAALRDIANDWNNDSRIHEFDDNHMNMRNSRVPSNAIILE